MNEDIAKIREFWDWFIQSITTTDNMFEDDTFLNSLDARLAKLGDVSWEIGPGVIDPDNNSFVLSPAGDRELLKLTTKYIRFAPKLEGWEFYSTKPPKTWQMRFTIQDERGHDVEIDASDWRYVLLKYDVGYDIVIQAPNIEYLPDDLRYSAVEILLDGEIGEETRMNRINCIELVKDFDSSLADKNNSIKVLKDHFRQLTSG